MFSQSCRPTPGLCRARVWVITPLSEAQGCRFFVFVQFRCAAPSATPTGTLFVLNIVQGYIRDCVLSFTGICFCVVFVLLVSAKVFPIAYLQMVSPSIPDIFRFLIFPPCPWSAGVFGMMTCSLY